MPLRAEPPGVALVFDDVQEHETQTRSARLGGYSNHKEMGVRVDGLLCSLVTNNNDKYNDSEFYFGQSHIKTASNNVNN